NFFIFMNASVTRFTFSESGSFSISDSCSGDACHETPNLSLSQPHCSASGTDERLQKWSISSCELHWISSDTASLKVKSACSGELSIAMNTSPLPRRNWECITEPSG